MSYATSLAHLDASTGLFASAVPGIMYALFGTCRQLNVGPEAALSLLIGQTISALLGPDMHPHEGAGKIAAEAVSTIVVFQVCSAHARGEKGERPFSFVQLRGNTNIFALTVLL